MSEARDVYFTNADGLRLFARDEGPLDAPLTVLCIHGLTRNHKDFQPMIAALRAAGAPWRFVSVDVRGRGQSDWDAQPERYHPGTYAADMFALMDRLGVERFAVVGTSMGGLISMVMMAQRPERLLGVVLNDVGPVLDASGLERIRNYVGEVAPMEDWEAAADTIAAAQMDVFPEFKDEDWLAFAHRTCRELEDGRVVFDYDPAIAGAVKAPTPDNTDLDAAWAAFAPMAARPLLIVRGVLSDILSAEVAEEMLERHPHAQLAEIPLVGHAPILDELAALEAIGAFLERLAREPAPVSG